MALYFQVGIEILNIFFYLPASAKAFWQLKIHEPSGKNITWYLSTRSTSVFALAVNNNSLIDYRSKQYLKLLRDLKRNNYLL